MVVSGGEWCGWAQRRVNLSVAPRLDRWAAAGVGIYLADSYVAEAGHTTRVYAFSRRVIGTGALVGRCDVEARSMRKAFDATGPALVSSWCPSIPNIFCNTFAAPQSQELSAHTFPRCPTSAPR